MAKDGLRSLHPVFGPHQRSPRVTQLVRRPLFRNAGSLLLRRFDRLSLRTLERLAVGVRLVVLLVTAI